MKSAAAAVVVIFALAVAPSSQDQRGLINAVSNHQKAILELDRKQKLLKQMLELNQCALKKLTSATVGVQKELQRVLIDVKKLQIANAKEQLRRAEAEAKPRKNHRIAKISPRPLLPRPPARVGRRSLMKTSDPRAALSRIFARHDLRTRVLGFHDPADGIFPERFRAEAWIRFDDSERWQILTSGLQPGGFIDALLELDERLGRLMDQGEIERRRDLRKRRPSGLPE